MTLGFPYVIFNVNNILIIGGPFPVRSLNSLNFDYCAGNHLQNCHTLPLSHPTAFTTELAQSNPYRGNVIGESVG